MKKQSYAKYFVLTTAILAVLAMTYAQTPNADSLKVLANRVGNYVNYIPPSSEPTYIKMDQVTLLSTDIVIGTVLSNKCNLSPNEDFITIDYVIRVDSLLKGSVSSPFTVSVPGGRVGFVDAQGNTTWAEIRSPWFKKMENGHQYYLFLTKAGLLASKYHVVNYETTGGPQGVFEIVNGVVKSNSGRLRDPIWQYHNMTVSSFDQLIHNLIATQNVGPVPSPTPQIGALP